MLLFRLYEKVTERDVFTLLFASAKSNPKQIEAAKRRCKIALWTPGERFKALHRHAFDKNCSFLSLKQLSGFEPVRNGSVVQTQNRVLWKIEVAVWACRRKRLIKWESTRYIGVVEMESWGGLSRSKPAVCIYVENRIFALLQNFPFS